ncbi:hypothetical protein [Laspinema olomoucense]|uniref:hypothetical protein n=1 Tax=Laspinema olomoucense TaxID=3231600 RepID=UPI0021BAA5A0|nr:MULTISPECIES: hypothetical protein [unclassified Laspinema]MCT7988121.1 hypothetical protein [Laspinema sp. D3a]MCT7994778.1 hypothetical protein [Laspinema sp. D3c]
MSFQSAIENTPALKAAYKKGLQALGSNSSKIKPGNSKKCEGSVDIDTTLVASYPNDSRWDYALGYDGNTYFVEVHSAKTDEVKTVLKKLAWLKDFLIQEAPELNQEPKQFHWIASSSNHILPQSSQSRQLANSGLKLSKELKL